MHPHLHTKDNAGKEAWSSIILIEVVENPLTGAQPARTLWRRSRNATTEGSSGSQ